MFESFNYETNELCATNQYLQTYIDRCHKESERRAAYPEKSTAHFNNVAYITISSYIITPQKKQNARDEEFHEDIKIHFTKNE